MKTDTPNTSCSGKDAFSRLELLFVLGTLAILLLVKVSALAVPRQAGQSVACMNNLRQLGAALLMYSAENNFRFPERCLPNSWAEKLRPYYKDLQTLQCPIDGPRGQTSGYDPRYPADMAPRSYIFNGWNDYFLEKAPIGDTWLIYASSNSISEAEIPLPRETIAFGEKLNFFPAFLYGFHGREWK